MGLPAILVCIEMALFAILHIFSYSWKPYRVEASAYVGGTLGWRALVDAANVWDIVKELLRSWKWVFTGAERGRDHAMEHEVTEKLGK